MNKISNSCLMLNWTVLVKEAPEGMCVKSMSNKAKMTSFALWDV